jgi:hypothetical protein
MEVPKKIHFTKPMEIKIAEALFLKFSKNMILIKELSKQKIHYSAFIIGSKIDFHLTLEDEKDPEKRHISLIEIQMDFEYLLEQIAREMIDKRQEIFQITTIDDPKIQKLKINIFQSEFLAKFFGTMAKKNRLNFDHEFLTEIDSKQSKKIIKITELRGIGFADNGQVIFSNGKECMLLNFTKILNNIDKMIDHSIMKIKVKYFTLSSLIWLIKIRLISINRSVVSFLRKVLS